MCLIAALDVNILSWFDLLLCTNHKHIRRDSWHEGKRWKYGLRCNAAAVLLYTDFVNSTHAYLVHTEAHFRTITHISTVHGYHKGERSQHGCCCTMTATSSTEPGGPYMLQYEQKQSKEKYRGEI